MGTLRTKQMTDAYAAYQKAGGLEGGCRLCDQPFNKEFKYWKIMPNKFPYDKVAVVHDMILPLRHADWPELTGEEKVELDEITKGYINTNYDFIIEPTTKKKSIPPHFHLHLLVVTD